MRKILEVIKNRSSLILVCALITGVAGMMLGGDVYGDEGEGADNSGVATSCSSTTNNAVTEVCDGGTTGGGASWRIFKTDDAYGLDDATDYEGSILLESYKNQAINTCKDKGWFASYGWDGRHGSHYGYSNFNFQIGPANRKPGQEIRNAEYNNYNAKDFNYLESNGFSNNTKITNGTALILYNKMREADGKEGVTAIPDDVGYFCYSPKEEFAGQSRVGPNYNNVAGGANGITSGSANANYQCDSACTVKIDHRLRRASGAKKQTTYTIERTSNIAGLTGTVVNDAETSGLTNNMKEYGGSRTYNLQPGQFVCEKLSFYGTTDTKSGKTVTQVCVTAGGTQRAAGITIDVKNDSVNAYSSYADVVYGKPKDDLTYQGTYTPSVQNYANEVPAKMAVNGGATCTSAYDRHNTSSRASAMLSSCGGGFWNNGFTIYSEHFEGSQFSKNHQYAIGSANTKTETNDHKVTAAEAGYSLDEVALTNSGVKTAPKSASWTTRCLTGPAKDDDGNVIKDEDGNVAQVTNCYPTLDVNTNGISDDTAHARIPYNFTNTTQMSTCNSEDMERYGNTCAVSNTTDGLQKKANEERASKTNSTNIFYAGEDATLHFTTTTHPRTNSTTNGTYATIVRQARIRLRFCVGAECDSGNYSHTTSPSASIGTIKNLNANTTNYANYNGATDSHSIKINIPDVAAGTKICVRSEVYPKDSGTNTNLDPNYYNINSLSSWAVSTPVCFTVAKRPSIQIWGGNVYSNGMISTKDAQKTNLAGRTYNVEGGGSRYVFGSWGELGVISNGVVGGFGSGASKGYAPNNGNGLIPNPYDNNSNSVAAGGSTSINFCVHSPLSFANDSCSGGQTGALNNALTGSSVEADISSVISRFIYGSGAGDAYKVSGDVTLNDVSKIKDTVYYYYGTSRLNLPEQVVDRGSTQVVHSTENITISGDLIYEDNYRSFGDVPKLVIYAEKDVNIGCNVSRIDGIIVAKGVVRTCAGEDGTIPEKDAEDRSLGQLKINGAVLAGKIIATRTYGAAAGSNSIIPAEIINFDPTLYRWGNDSTEGSTGDDSVDVTTNLDVTYERELAPRY